MGILDFFKNKYNVTGFTKEQRAIQEKYACYFNEGGKGLTKEEIKEINKSLLNYAVVEDKREIEFVKDCLMVATLTEKQKRFFINNTRKEIKEKLFAGEVVGKHEADIVAKTVIFKTPGYVYTVEINDDVKDLNVKATPYMEHEEKEREKILGEVQKYNKVAKCKSFGKDMF